MGELPVCQFSAWQATSFDWLVGAPENACGRGSEEARGRCIVRFCVCSVGRKLCLSMLLKSETDMRLPEQQLLNFNALRARARAALDKKSHH